jgi:hypothetical protein
MPFFGNFLTYQDMNKKLLVLLLTNIGVCILVYFLWLYFLYLLEIQDILLSWFIFIALVLIHLWINFLILGKYKIQTPFSIVLSIAEILALYTFVIL